MQTITVDTAERIFVGDFVKVNSNGKLVRASKLPRLAQVALESAEPHQKCRITLDKIDRVAYFESP
jgi:hypothetical protein